MAVTRLSDVIVPEVFLDYMVKDTKEKTSIFTSGILVSDDTLAAKLAGGGTTFQVPFWKDLDNTEPNIASDNPASEATPLKVDATKMRAIRQFRTQGWSDADLVRELAGSDPMQRIVSRVGAYWARAFQRQLVSTLTGVFADNTANDSGDMTYDISANSGAAAQISAEAILETAQTMGDAASELNTLIMHSRVYTTLAKQNLIDFIPDSNGVVRFPTYLGYQVIVDDGVNTTTAGADVDYETYLVANGAVAWAESPPDVPVETDRFPAQGDGSGVEQLWTRRQYVMHPYGFDWLDASVAGQFPTNTEIEAAANWNRVYPERKQIGIARLVTKNG